MESDMVICVPISIESISISFGGYKPTVINYKDTNGNFKQIKIRSNSGRCYSDSLLEL